VLGSETIQSIAPRLDDLAVIVALGVLSIAGTILGYDFIHACARLVSYVSGAAFAFTLVWLAVHSSLPADLLTRNSVTVQGVLGALSIAALWQIAYAPYVSDYSRYLPPVTGVRTAFWATYIGSVVGSIVPMALGVAIGLVAKDGGVIATLGYLTSDIAPLTFVVFSVAMITNNAINVYCGALSTLTVIQTWRPQWQPGWLARSVVALILLGIALTLALLGRKSFLESYTSFILLLFYVLIPWTAINLVVYYLVKHGEYGATIFFRETAFGIGRHPFRAPALPIEEVKDPTGAGDSFAGGFMGYIASQGELSREVLKRALFYGGVMGSFAVERFGTERLQSLTREEIDARFQIFRELTHLE